MTGVPLPPDELAAIVVATSFAAGLNVYLTVATLGLLARAGIVSLPASLLMLTSWWIIGAAGALFVVEFVADKIPAFDLVWNALQTAVRVPVGALLAFGATVQLSAGKQLLAAALGGAIALAAHSGKTAVRTAVTASPEPFSNIALSLGEDALAVFITWLATRHPIWALTIVISLLAAIVVAVRAVLRALASLFRSGVEQVPSD
jgi:hypothetical protein